MRFLVTPKVVFLGIEITTGGIQDFSIDAGGIRIKLQAATVVIFMIVGGAFQAFDRMAGRCAGPTHEARQDRQRAPNTCCQHY